MIRTSVMSLMLILYFSVFVGVSTSQDNNNCQASVLGINNVANIRLLATTNILNFNLATYTVNLSWDSSLLQTEHYQLLDTGVFDSSNSTYFIQQGNQYIQTIIATTLYTQSNEGDFIIGYKGLVRLWPIKLYHVPVFYLLVVIIIGGYGLTISHLKPFWKFLTGLLTVVSTIAICYYLSAKLIIFTYTIGLIFVAFGKPILLKIFREALRNDKVKFAGLKIFLATFFVFGIVLPLTIMISDLISLSDHIIKDDVVYLNTTHTSSVSVSPDDSFLAVGANYSNSPTDYSIRIFDTQSGNLLITLIGHEAPVENFYWTDNGSFLISVDANENMIIWGILPDGCSILREPE
jgi:WD40 repeat protein